MGGNLHGGAVALIFDITTSTTIAACSREGFWDTGHVSRNLNCTYLRPAPEGATVFVESRVVHLGKRMGLTTGVMRLGSMEGKVCYTYVPSQSSPAQKPPQVNPEDHPDGDGDNEAASSEKPAPNAAATQRSSAARGPRRRQHGVQSTKLEAVDDPLGPLGAPTPTTGSDAAPAPPQKELAASRGSRPAPGASAPSLGGMMDSVNLDDDDNDDELPRSQAARVPPPVQAPAGTQQQRQTQPSVSVEQAAKPTFSIYVGDPHKVGDLTSSHTEYSVTTKTTSKGYRNPEFSVSRRYRDFLWLYTQMHSNNPGVIIPPPPEKQAVGRFETDFVESRRAALERMLNKTATHPILQHDGDLKLFLESDAFNVDIKNKERKDPGLGESKGMFGSMLSGSSGKFVEHDDWFHDRKIYLDALENQLKALLKATDTVVTQRKGLAEACGDFSASLHSLSAVELSPSLSTPLDSLSDIQIRIRELYERQAQQDVLTMGIVIDEYIRLIGSVKTAFLQRQKAYHSWHAAEQELQKRKTTQDKLLRQGRSQQDRLNQLGADVADAERRVHQARLLFDDMGRLMRSELERFEREKVEDFKSGVETYLESAVEAQKELIEIWETFLMQLDTEEGETFIPPAGVVASPTAEPPTSANEPTDARNSEESVRSIRLQEFDPEAGKLVGPSKTIFYGTELDLVEGPHLYKRNGWYYLLTAEGGTSYSHACTLARSSNIWGPYELHPQKHILTSKDAPTAPLQKAGHGDLVETSDGKAYLVHLGGRPRTQARRCVLGRETSIQEAYWSDDGWLYIKNGPVPSHQVELPAARDETKYWAEQRYVFDNTNGLHEDFQWLRTPEPERIFSVKDGLQLVGRESVGSWFEQALVARRQTHFSYDAETVIDFSPTDERQFAGLIAYYCRYNFFYLTVTADADGQRELLIQSSEASWPEGCLQLPFADPVQIPNEGKVKLALSIRGSHLQFSYALGEEARLEEVGPVYDASVLSDECGGHQAHGSFTGAFVGVAASDLNGTEKTASFGYFVYRPVSHESDGYDS
ncbi:glycoside hydrolase family 43 protein [Dothidotthia symphoricarpi CBS 119687]|uniref:Glycoside hydrolase family 43 protein n=1 Tax=Dothidotthia symphoricarpi CBS 119687 TaxID=1392245 RepID=A0A6A6ALI1_9PLEO|nr:glycoside hydrolase family 43 protein [Dothidotthia symphoricarpi CBS 119687]KAF2131968.1 glycoside hydrolase family 43 protein [Dothidotthia symphoricarpi CBS 119687]